MTLATVAAVVYSGAIAVVALYVVTRRPPRGPVWQRCGRMFAGERSRCCSCSPSWACCLLSGVRMEDPNGIAVGDRVLWSEHEAYCNTDDVFGVITGSKPAEELPGRVAYRMQPTCAGVPVGPSVLLPLTYVVLMDGAS